MGRLETSCFAVAATPLGVAAVSAPPDPPLPTPEIDVTATAAAEVEDEEDRAAEFGGAIEFPEIWRAPPEMRLDVGFDAEAMPELSETTGGAPMTMTPEESIIGAIGWQPGVTGIGNGKNQKLIIDMREMGTQLMERGQ